MRGSLSTGYVTLLYSIVPIGNYQNIKKDTYCIFCLKPVHFHFPFKLKVNRFKMRYFRDELSEALLNRK